MPVPSELSSALAPRYRIERELGAGGMATVYLAHDLKHDRPVALKVLRPELAAVIGADRFLAEIRTTANLQHPRILPLFDSGNANGRLFYVMPFVEGETLRQRLDRGHGATVAEAVALVADVADALDYAHRRGVVHRDVKPDNILLHEGRPVVADFGIAMTSAGADATRATVAGMALGTPGYMSPEQALGHAVDARSDQYSLACVLVELLRAAPASGSDSETAIAPSATNPGGVAPDPLPPAIEAAVSRALARDPERRFPTVRAFVEALHAAAGDAGPSIAVLPFANLSGDRDSEYFADGMSDEIRTALTQLPGLKVVGRTSAFAFRDRADDLRTIGEKLNVRHLLEGSVRRAGHRLRITAQLVDATNGYQEWAERYDRQLDDVFAIQDEIATAIASRLRVTLGAGAPARLVTPATDNLQAYDEYLRGLALMHRRGSGIADAIACFKRAIALDPECAPALAGLARALILLCFWGFADPRQVGPIAAEAAARAMAVDPALVDAHLAAAFVALVVDFDRARAAAHWDRALALGEGDVDARATGAVFYLCYMCADYDDAERELRHAIERDPLSHTFHAQLGLVLAFAGRAAESRAAAERAIALDPGALFGRWILIEALLVAGQYEELLAAGTDIMRKFGRNGWILTGMLQASAALGRMEAASAIFDELAARARTEYVQPTILALCAMALGRRDEAVQRWVQAIRDRDCLVVAMMHAPNSAALRAEPEHADIVRAIGWEGPWRRSGRVP